MPMRKATVLAVEDLRLVAKDLQQRLKRLGYDVLMATDADEAIRIAAKQRPDVVLMDIALNGPHDGVEVAGRVRSLGIPVIFLTAHTDQDTVQRAQATSPAGYVLKPFDDRELDAVIRQTLPDSSARSV